MWGSVERGKHWQLRSSYSGKQYCQQISHNGSEAAAYATSMLLAGGRGTHFGTGHSALRYGVRVPVIKEALGLLLR